MNVPTIAPIKVTEYETKQSKYSHCGKLPIRSIVLGPSGSGKTVLLTNLILDIYKGCLVVFTFLVQASTWIRLGHLLRNTLTIMIYVGMKNGVCLIIMTRKSLKTLLKHSERWFSTWKTRRRSFSIF